MNVLPIKAIPVESYVDASPISSASANPAIASPHTSKSAIRTSLRASTVDGIFATIFSNVAGGVLLSNFLVELDATAIEVGMLSSIPMLANLCQPLGAYLSERTTSRHLYCLWVYGPSRLLWLILAAGIGWVSWGQADPHLLVNWTLGIVLISHFLGALGSASWLSWLAVLVPRRLRGRYFGIRNSAASFTNLVSVPLLGWLITIWSGGTLQGYGLVLLLGIAAGLVSLGFQCLMVDVNPQIQHALPPEKVLMQAAHSVSESEPNSESKHPPAPLQFQDWGNMLKDANFLQFLFYISLWMFAVNLSAPFFNLYLLDDLNLDVRWVTIYNSLGAGANLLMLVVWGRIADRVGNRSVLLFVGILVAVTPLLWLGTGADNASIWLWLPLLHILSGGTWAAIDLCSNNLQIGVAPARNQASYFAVAAAIAGVSGALGTTAGGLLTQFANSGGLLGGGLLGLFALSSVMRLVALLPLVFVHEQRGQRLHQVMQVLFPARVEE
jgi:MFS family permease